MVKNKIDLNPAISNVLRYGVLLSSALIFIGVVGLLVKGMDSISISQLVNQRIGRPTLNFQTLFYGVVRFDPIYVIQLGLLVLLATPILRVAISIGLFAFENDWKYVLITITVLCVLLFSIFVVGPFEALTH
jgi:uncharacterized membrane protein